MSLFQKTKQDGALDIYSPELGCNDSLLGLLRQPIRQLVLLGVSFFDRCFLLIDRKKTIREMMGLEVSYLYYLEYRV